MPPFQRLDRIHKKIRALIWMQAVLLALTVVLFVKTWNIWQIVKTWRN
jgi:hypothetical protein